MIVVLDTNVIFSAIISPSGTSGKIDDAWRLARFKVVTSDFQLNELQRVSRYPKMKSILTPADVGAVVNDLLRTTVLRNLNLDFETDDPDDTFLLSMSVAGQADYLVTGDKRAGLLRRKHIGKTNIVSPTMFVFCLSI